MGNSLNDLDFDIDNLLNDTLREESNSLQINHLKRKEKERQEEIFLCLSNLYIYIIYNSKY